MVRKSFFHCYKEQFASQLIVFFSYLDSSMEMLDPPSHEEAVSNIDTDADIADFDTDLPAAHNVRSFASISIFHESTTFIIGFVCISSIWVTWSVCQVCNT